VSARRSSSTVDIALECVASRLEGSRARDG
jgi:hypothetical protein